MEKRLSMIARDETSRHSSMRESFSRSAFTCRMIEVSDSWVRVVPMRSR